MDQEQADTIWNWSANVSWSDRFNSLLSQISNKLITKILDWLIPVLKLLLTLLLIVMSSIIAHYFIRRAVIPKSILRETIYFDMTKFPHPLATMQLANREQWTYVKQLDPVTTSTTTSAGGVAASFNPNGLRYLKSGESYSIQLSFTLALSDRNMLLGTFMSTTTLIDGTGEAFARSVRPVSIPFRSWPSRFLDAVVYFPVRCLGMSSLSEVVSTKVVVMNKFVEPVSSKPPTMTIEVELSTPAVDIEHVDITLLPALYGFTYYMYHYSFIMFFVVVGCLSCLQCSLLCCLYLTIKVVNLSMNMFTPEMSLNTQSNMQTVTRSSHRHEEKNSARGNNVRIGAHTNRDTNTITNSNNDINRSDAAEAINRVMRGNSNVSATDYYNNNNNDNNNNNNTTGSITNNSNNNDNDSGNGDDTINADDRDGYDAIKAEETNQLEKLPSWYTSSTSSNAGNVGNAAEATALHVVATTSISSTSTDISIDTSSEGNKLRRRRGTTINRTTLPTDS